MTVIEESSTITLLLVPSLQQKVSPVAEQNRGHIHTITEYTIIKKYSCFQFQ